MAFPRSLLIAARALRRNRLQTALTLLGMTIGVGTVLVMTAVGSGAQRSIQGQVRAAGMNILVVKSGNYKMPQQWTSQGEAEEPTAWHPQAGVRLDDGVFHPGRALYFRRMQLGPSNSPGSNPFQRYAQSGENQGGQGAAQTLTFADAAAIGNMAGVEAVSGGMHDNVTASAADGSKAATQLRGEQASLQAIRRAWVLVHGRFFRAGEGDVAVLGSVVSKALFGEKNPVGSEITVRGRSLRVIGVIASGSWMVPSAAGDGQFDAVYVPADTVAAMLGRDWLDTVTVTTQSTGDVTRVSKSISALLRARHHLAATLADDFTVESQAKTAIAHGGMRTDISRAMMGNANNLDKLTLEQLGKTLEQANRTMAALLAATAAVSLLVGGIGIMNVMLLSVTERTREIGIRRAVGAQSGELKAQFLLEAMLLSVGGGLLGIAFGIAVSLAVARLVQWSTQLSWQAVAVSFGISAAIGIVFGYYPARQASLVSPMTSLRYE